MIAEEKRPTIEELDGYVRRYDEDEDYTGLELELLAWLSDHRKDEALAAKSKTGIVPMYDERARRGYAELTAENFSLEEVKKMIHNK